MSSSKPGETLGIKEANRLVDICLDQGINFFDTANGYSDGAAEDILGEVIRGRRSRCLISTKATFPTGDKPEDYGSNRAHITRELDRSLRRLRTDYVDLYIMHGWDAHTPLEETIDTLDVFVKAGKVRHIGCSNFPAWHLMKSLAYSDATQKSRYVSHQAYYSLVGRDIEFDHIPLALDQVLELWFGVLWQAEP